ncbi:TetR family transcriptional regulator [Streptomyces sp. NPDC003077]|uniref:TetR/AcrR family transcriptional regulator n=1 Tax=Streptomyces sp. NPDC003077 TaxID=3154443 RepID=UPI0033A23EE3
MNKPSAPTAPTADGRRLKGEQRKRELIEATLQVVGREGIAGVSHRVVSREAGQPPTAAAYHFKGIGDLLAVALTACMEQDAARLRAAGPDGGPEGLRDLARVMADAVAVPHRLLAEYELFLLAARRPELRVSTRNWLDSITEFGRRYTTDPVRLRVLAGTFDGLLMHALLTDDPPTAEEYEAALRMILL